MTIVNFYYKTIPIEINNEFPQTFSSENINLYSNIDCSTSIGSIIFYENLINFHKK